MNSRTLRPYIRRCKSARASWSWTASALRWRLRTAASSAWRTGSGGSASIADARSRGLRPRTPCSDRPRRLRHPRGARRGCARSARRWSRSAATARCSHTLLRSATTATRSAAPRRSQSRTAWTSRSRANSSPPNSTASERIGSPWAELREFDALRIRCIRPIQSRRFAPSKRTQPRTTSPPGRTWRFAFANVTSRKSRHAGFAPIRGRPFSPEHLAPRPRL